MVTRNWQWLAGTYVSTFIAHQSFVAHLRTSCVLTAASIQDKKESE